MGPGERQPAPPRFDWTRYAEPHLAVGKSVQECNWLQALEGGIDTSHAPILHRLITPSSKRGGISPTSAFVRGKAPKLVVDLTDWGYQYAGLRPLDAADMHIRTYHFVMPFHQIRPYQTHKGFPAVAGHIWVPMDDENTMVYNWHHSTTEQPLDDDDRAERRSGNGPGHVDQATFRSKANRANNYLLDRKVQKTETFTGIDGINTQDRGIQESMGRVVDRSKEHLGPADKAIIQARRLLLAAVKTVQEGGTPRGLAPTYYPLRASEGVVPRDADWRELLTPEMATAEILQTV
jgi:hypothetical protein